MASDKEKMLTSANYYAGLVASAKKACSEAKVSLNNGHSVVQSNWKGESGDAMAQALNDLLSELNSICKDLAELESQMRSHTKSIYDNWPEEAISET